MKSLYDHYASAFKNLGVRVLVESPSSDGGLVYSIEYKGVRGVEVGVNASKFRAVTLRCPITFQDIEPSVRAVLLEKINQANAERFGVKYYVLPDFDAVTRSLGRLSPVVVAVEAVLARTEDIELLFDTYFSMLVMALRALHTIAKTVTT